MTDITRYYNMLDTHNWSYDRVDDPQIYHLGSQNHSRLSIIAKESPEHARLWKEFNGYVRGLNPKPSPPEKTE